MKYRENVPVGDKSSQRGMGARRGECKREWRGFCCMISRVDGTLLRPLLLNCSAAIKILLKAGIGWADQATMLHPIPPQSAQAHSILSHSNSFRSVTSHPIPPHLTPSHPAPPHPIEPHPTPSHPIPSHPTSSHLLPSHPRT